MKKLILFVCLQLWAFSYVAAQENNERNLTSKVTEVVVYMQGALVVETANASLAQGKQTYVFQDIPAGVDPSKIHVNTMGWPSGVKLLAVAHRLPGKFDAADDKLLRSLNDSLRTIQDEYETVTASLSAYEQEKKLLLANQSIGGQQSGVTVSELQKAADFYRSRLADIDKQVQKLRKKERLLVEEISRSNSKIALARQRFDARSNSIALTIFSAERSSAQIKLQYLLSGQTAGWAPIYDVKVKDISSALQLHYRGRVFNNTGVDWENIKLTLSTADPYQGAQKPDLQPWTLNYNNRNNYYRANSGSGYGEGRLNSYYTPSDSMRGYNGSRGSSSVKFAEVAVSELSVDFAIKEPGIIPSDAKPYSVDVQTFSLPASYKYFSVPKVDKDAFLVAHITGWESLNLIEGPVNVYFAENYTGQSYLNTRFANDTMELSLGRDKKVTVTRIKREDFTQKRLVGVNRTENYMYEIAVRNNNSQPVEIELYDQVPVSQESDIVVSVSEVSGAEREDLSGKLTWQMNVAPAQTEKKTLAFSVKYPKYRSVQVTQWRKINCPDFNILY